ncbi:calcium-binding protein (plasmid) [Streptomyces sp. NBC_01351]|uniref:calcium-binding protein n=1 Tax=Streptomyces sp. NBC_01351 TaxID=2903833 RepID=UPI002E3744E4|nr:calcium-binding protein [Streptomyces sp. NBC_01351]
MTTDFGGFDLANAVAVQADGKLVVAGHRGLDETTDFALARYNHDGSPDATFDGDGKVTTDFSGGGDNAISVAVQADGKIITAGFSFTNNLADDTQLARYNADGSLDTSFGTGGKVTTDLGGHDGAHKVLVQDDGKILTIGFGDEGSDAEFMLARFETDGRLDTSFDGDGKATTAFGGFGLADGGALQADGKILAAGYTTAGVGGSDDFAVARYNRDGSPDVTFDGDGKATTDFGSDERPNGLAVQADGKIVVGGSRFTDTADGTDFALARYTTGGGLDATFDGDGKVTTDFGDGDGDGAQGGVAVQADGKILAAGFTRAGGSLDFALVRYTTNGGMDTSFGTGGKAVADFGTRAAATQMAVQDDGRIVVVGYTFAADGSDFALARFHAAPAEVDLSVTKAGPATISLGDQASYTLTVTNTNATVRATDVTLSDTVTGPGTVVSVTPSQGSCTTTATSATSATCTLGSLPPGATATVTVVVEPTAAGTLSDTATTSSAETDPASDNNTATANTTVDNAHGCTILDTSTSNTIAGTGGDDVICGLGGNDVINGGNGNDVIYSGSGNDAIDSSNGTDTVDGGPGNDTLIGGNGNDTLTGGPGNDMLIGGSGNDTLTTTDGVTGNDTADGGTGIDTCTTDQADIRISCP